MSLPAFFTVFLYFLLFILIPGFLLFNLIFKDKKSFTWIELIPLSFVFGLVFFAMIGFPAYLFHFSHLVFYVVFSFAVIALLLIDIYLLANKKRDLILESSKYSVWTTAFFVILALLLIILFFPSTAGGDRVYHISVMRHLAVHDPITPYFSLFKDVSKIDAPYGYNIWHLFGSMIFRLVSIDPNIIWEYLIIILTPIQALSFGFLVRKLNKNNLFYFIALTIYFTMSGVAVLGWYWSLSPYPDQIAFNTIMPVILGLWILFLQKEKLDKRTLIAIVLSAVTLLLVHMFSVVYFLIAIVGMMIFSFLAERKYQILKKGFYILVFWLVLSAPILYFKYLAYLQIVPTNTGAANSKIKSVGNFFIVNPEIWRSNWTYAAIIITLLLLIWQFIKKRKVSLPILFCFTLTFFAAFLSFVPPVSTFVSGIITSTYLARLASIIPVGIIFSLLIFELIKNKKILSWVAIIILLLVLFGTIFTKRNELISTITNRVQRRENLLVKNQFYEYINKNIPYSSVIAATPNISLRMSYFTNNYLVMIKQSGCPAIIDKTKRLADLNGILNSGFANQNKSLFEQYQVDYIVSSGNKEYGFTKYPELFTEVYSEGNQVIFKINR